MSSTYEFVALNRVQLILVWAGRFEGSGASAEASLLEVPRRQRKAGVVCPNDLAFLSFCSSLHIQIPTHRVHNAARLDPPTPFPQSSPMHILRKCSQQYGTSRASLIKHWRTPPFPLTSNYGAISPFLPITDLAGTIVVALVSIGRVVSISSISRLTLILENIWRLVTIIDDGSQNQMRERWIHERLLCRWHLCYFVSKAWSVNQHRLQGGHCILCGNW